MIYKKGFQYVPFSKKQLFLMNWWAMDEYKDMDGIICDGSIRSGKSCIMSLSFVLWAFDTFDEGTFAICGKTIKSVRRNLINPLKKMLKGRNFKVMDNRSEDKLTISIDGVTNEFHLFGGKDEGSQDLIQGLTLDGLLMDEVALMPKSFVNQSTGRCSSEKSKKWFNCNPSHPNHFFYTDYILRVKVRELLRVHFTMNDNPSMSENKRRKYRVSYNGVFFKRFILGLWCATDGLVYEEFANNKDDFIIDKNTEELIHLAIGVDFGGSKSGHTFTLVGFTRRFHTMIVLDEYRNRKRINPKKLEDDFICFLKKVKKKYKVYEVYCDSADQTLIAGLETAVVKNKIYVDVKNAIKGEIIDRIAFFNTMIAQGRFKIEAHCTETIQAMETAVYDDKKFEDKRLDNGTSNIDSIDSMEYAVESVMKDVIRII